MRTPVTAEEKRAVYDRLHSYRAAHGVGCFAALSKLTYGAVTENQIRMMWLGEIVPNGMWRTIGKALNKIEKAPAEAATSTRARENHTNRIIAD